MSDCRAMPAKTAWSLVDWVVTWIEANCFGRIGLAGH